VKIIYSLKSSAQRRKFLSSLGTEVRRLRLKAFDACCAAICLIKDGELSRGLDVIANLAEEGFTKNERLDLLELIGVLWAERELASEEMTFQQAGALKIVVEFLGGPSIFSISDEHSPAASVNAAGPFQPADYPSCSVPTPRCIVVARRAWWSEPGVSRAHELPYKLSQVFSDKGQGAEIIYTEDLPRCNVYDLPSKTFFIVDVQATSSDKLLGFISAAQKKSSKVIGLYADLHYAAMSQDELEALDALDVIWAPSASPEQLRYFSPNPKFTDFPVPLGLRDCLRPSVSISDKESFSKKALFVGGIERNNISRIIYYIDSKIDDRYSFDLSTHLADGQSAENGYVSYLGRLAKSGLSLNFSLRYSGVPALTGKVIESVATGHLLVQEECPQIQRWFSENMHFVSFNGIESLRAQLDFVYSNPGIACTIASEGRERYEKKFSEKACLKHILFKVGAY
jgi:hypothetical protein